MPELTEGLVAEAAVAQMSGVVATAEAEAYESGKHGAS